MKKEVINDINTFHIRFKAQTEGFTDLIFPIDDVINIWLEENSLLPINIEEIIKEKNSSILDIGDIKKSSKEPICFMLIITSEILLILYILYYVLDYSLIFFPFLKVPVEF